MLKTCVPFRFKFVSAVRLTSCAARTPWGCTGNTNKTQNKTQNKTKRTPQAIRTLAIHRSYARTTLLSQDSGHPHQSPLQRTAAPTHDNTHHMTRAHRAAQRRTPSRARWPWHVRQGRNAVRWGAGRGAVVQGWFLLLRRYALHTLSYTHT